MANNYSKFDAVMDELLTGEKGTTSTNFSGAALGDFAEHQDLFWDGLLQYLQNENEKSGGTFGIRQSVFPQKPEVESVIEYINDNADMIDSFLDGCLTNLPHWNESFSQLLGIYKQYFVDHGEIDHTNITVEDVIRANAGNNFNNGFWVKPWENVDGASYAEVRHNDKIRRVLNDKKFLQFTHKLFEKYIRLLMPEYQRTVEVEDLNRNFWVIGQVLTGVLSFLFDEDSPINDLFNGMLDELAQLWENLLYLWAAFALISQAIRENDIMVLTIPVSNLENEPYIKFDDFTKNSSSYMHNFWSRMKYLKDIYNRSTLIIIPEIRQNAYLENYYSTALYPGVIIYNRKIQEGIANLVPATNQGLNTHTQEDVQYLYFQKGIIAKPLNVEIGDNLIINGNRYTNNPWGVFENSPYYYFKNDFADDEAGLTGAAYVAAIRTIFEVTIPPIFTDGALTAFSIKATCIDVPRQLEGSTNEEIYSCDYDMQGGKLVCANEVINDAAEQVEYDNKPILEGWYRGEVVSWIHKASPSFNIVLTKEWENLHVIPEYLHKDAVIKMYGEDTDGIFICENYYTFQYPGTDGAESKTIPVKGYSPGGQIINYTFTEESMGQGWISHYQNDIINIDSPSNEAVFTNRGEDTQTETENLFTSNAYVLKIGNYLPTDGVFSMSSMYDGNQYLFTSMRGNVMKSRSNISVYNRTSDTKYYRFRWDTYTGENDGDYTTPVPNGMGNNICYSKNPTQKSSSYPTQSRLDYDGLLAVKNFIEKNPSIKKNPAYFLTTVGLTPWQGGGRTGADIYWDSAFVHALYFYIPTIQTLTGDPDIGDNPNVDISEYVNAYNELTELTLSTDDTDNGELPVELVGTIEENGTVIGKIVACNKIARYEGYYNHYGNTKDGIQNFLSASGSCWRQFFVTNNDTNNKCYRIDYNQGAQAGGFSKYVATFAPQFYGYVRYFDVRRYQALKNMNRASLLINEPRAQDSYADVYIDKAGYAQTKEGKIVRTDNNSNAYNVKESIATSNTVTGFPQKYDTNNNPEDIYSLMSSCVGKSAGIFHGNTKLSTSSVCQYK